MTDEISLKRAMAQGEQAARTLEAHRDLWAELEADIWKMWKASKSDDKDGREDLYRELHGIKAVQARLKRIVDHGKKAEEELKQQKVRHGN